MELLVEYMARGFFTMLSISMPCVLVAASVGLVVGILQAVTQVQEQTIAAAPKIVGVFLTIVILGMFYIKILTQYINEGAYLAFNIVPKSESYVLPANYYKHTKPFAAEMKDTVSPNSGEIKEIMQNPGKIPWVERQEKNKYTPSYRGANPRPNLIETNKIIGR
ncbi:MAG: flagellar biosynthetic protein FliQ [Candidatus Gastranaerophilales bacterium]|nr:flagellar biosynthetic protein FliQ [Candidatus Gastranaerophilales bacterium]